MFHMLADHPTASMFTTGELCRELGQPMHKVLYLLKTLAIEPASRAGGHYRLFDRSALDRLRAALAERKRVIAA